MIKEIAFTAYPAKDVAALRKWYEEKLGLKFAAHSKRTASRNTTKPTLAAVTSAFSLHEWVDREPGSASGIVFEVDNIEDTIADLRAKGVEVEDPYATPVCKIASFERPRRQQGLAASGHRSALVLSSDEG